MYIHDFDPFLSYSVGFDGGILYLDTTDVPGMFVLILLIGFLLNIQFISMNLRKHTLLLVFFVQKSQEVKRAKWP